MTFSFSDFELMVENKVTDDITVKVDSDRVHPLVYIKCEVSKLWKAQFGKYYSGLFPIEQQADVIVQLSGSPLDVTLCFSVAAVCLSFISGFFSPPVHSTSIGLYESTLEERAKQNLWSVSGSGLLDVQSSRAVSSVIKLGA